jgi:hypothetical protein
MTISEADTERRHGRLTIIVPKDAYGILANQLNLVPLIDTDVWVLAETQST